MQLGILHKFDKNTDLALAVRLARRAFEHAPHCAGHTAAEVHFNPNQLPLVTGRLNGQALAGQLAYIDGLCVISNPFVKIWHIRVCTRDLTAAEELAAEMTYFDRQVQIKDA